MIRNMLIGFLALTLTACQTSSPRQSLALAPRTDPVSTCEAEIYRTENQQTLNCARLLEIWN